MKEAVGYLRVSDPSQVNGTGFERQEETIKTFAAKNGFKIRKVFKETCTGTAENRFEFSRMIEELLNNGCRTIIIESLDRFARDSGVQYVLLSLLIRHEISLFSALNGENVTENYGKDPVSRFMVQILGDVSELEKNLINRRLQSARDRKSVELGKRIEGKKPYGTFPGESEVLEKVFRLHRKPRGEKRLGFYKIARILNDQGVPTRTGKPWTGPTVGGIIRREKGL